MASAAATPWLRSPWVMMANAWGFDATEAVALVRLFLGGDEVDEMAKKLARASLRRRLA